MKKIVGIGLGIGWLACGLWSNAETNIVSMAEVIGALKSRYVDREALDDRRLNDAALTGILRSLGQGATLMSPDEETPSSRSPISETLARVEIIDPNIGYIRIADVVEQTPATVDVELRKFSDAKVSGAILDLRFADGASYEAAAAVASRFLNDGQALFSWKSATMQERVFHASSTATGPWKETPLLILVNAETRGAAETLAGALRAQGRAILVGNTTDGSPAAWDEVRLSDGRRLRMANAKILLPSQEAAVTMTVSLFPDGLTPDVAVPVDLKTERQAVLSAQTNVTLTAILQPAESRKRLTEAELVRAFRGEPLELKTGVSTHTTLPTLSEEPTSTEPSAKKTEATPSVDMVLQRAVDILKGIRVLLSSRCPVDQ